MWRRVRKLMAFFDETRCRLNFRRTHFYSGLGEGSWLLHGLVRALRPTTVVEIGSARGNSTCAMGMALKANDHGRLFAIDPHTPTAWNDTASVETLPILQSNLRRTGVTDWVEIVRKASEQAANDWQLPIDLIFIDGDHTYAGVKRDWDLFSPYVTPFGVALFHDTTWELHKDSPNYRADCGVPQFVEELRLAGYPVLTLDVHCGISMVQNCPGGRPLFPTG